ncbi:MAG TPA: hypothetical protein VNU66_09225, partial [Mycobacteriales bacterium]|nr:hypothetical protein [Mycobacteriales bacterium]
APPPPTTTATATEEEEPLAPAPAATSVSPTAEPTATPTPSASPAPVGEVVAEDVPPSDPVARLVQLVLGAAVLLGIAGGTGLYLTREGAGS